MLLFGIWDEVWRRHDCPWLFFVFLFFSFSSVLRFKVVTVDGSHQLSYEFWGESVLWGRGQCMLWSSRVRHWHNRILYSLLWTRAWYFWGNVRLKFIVPRWCFIGLIWDDTNFVSDVEEKDFSLVRNIGWRWILEFLVNFALLRYGLWAYLWFVPNTCFARVVNYWDCCVYIIVSSSKGINERLYIFSPVFIF